MSLRSAIALLFSAALVVIPARAEAADAPITTGGTAYQTPPAKPKATKKPGAATSAQAPLPTATVGDDGLALAPAGAPPQVAALIAAGNAIASTPYKYGGGHGSFDDTAYDCSGSVSYALHGAGLLDATLDSTALSKWGAAGAGAWITIYANKTHTYLIVAGLRFDTSGAKAAGSRWQAAPRSSKGFKIRHPDGL
jgi:cell wall-associated NlpC family hydrolase